MLRPPQVNKAVQSDVLKVVRRVLLFYDMSLLHKTSIILQTIKNTKRDNKNINVRYSSNSLCHRKLEVKKCNLLVRSQKIEEWRRRGLVLTTESSFTVQRSGVGGGVSFSSPSWQWTVLRRRRDVWSGGPSGWRSAGRAALWQPIQRRSPSWSGRRSWPTKRGIHCRTVYRFHLGHCFPEVWVHIQTS